MVKIYTKIIHYAYCFSAIFNLYTHIREQNVLDPGIWVQDEDTAYCYLIPSPTLNPLLDTKDGKIHKTMYLYTNKWINTYIYIYRYIADAPPFPSWVGGFDWELYIYIQIDRSRPCPGFGGRKTLTIWRFWRHFQKNSAKIHCTYQDAQPSPGSCGGPLPGPKSCLWQPEAVGRDQLGQLEARRDRQLLALARLSLARRSPEKPVLAILDIIFTHIYIYLSLSVCACKVGMKFVSAHSPSYMVLFGTLLPIDYGNVGNYNIHGCWDIHGLPSSTA